jgi:hypothetical protein
MKKYSASTSKSETSEKLKTAISTQFVNLADGLMMDF